MEFSVENKQGVYFVRLVGDLIGEQQGAGLVEFFSDQVNEGFTKGVVDLAQVRYINSSGLGLLITILTKLRNKGGDLLLQQPSDQISKLLLITKLNNIFTIVNNDQEALAKLS